MRALYLLWVIIYVPRPSFLLSIGHLKKVPHFHCNKAGYIQEIKSIAHFGFDHMHKERDKGFGSLSGPILGKEAKAVRCQERYRYGDPIHRLDISGVIKQ